jgi:uncharacterized protein YbjT (DUF2867 family)
MATVLVLGATGYAGRHLVHALHDAGHRVRVVVRDRDRALRPGANGAPSLAGAVEEWVLCPELGSEVDASIVTGIDHVVSALGVTRQRADPCDVDFALNLRFLELAEQSAVRTFQYLGVQNAASGTSALVRAKHAFTQVLRRSDVTAQIINPSAYFSDLTAVYRMARRGLAMGVRDGGVRLTPIHGADLADFCVSVLDGPAGRWDVGGPEVLTYRQIVRVAFAAAGTTERYLPIPGPALRAGTAVADRVGPRVSSLTRFLLEGLSTDATGELVGTRRIRDHFAALAASERPRRLGA